MKTMKTALIAAALLATAGFANAQSATYAIDPTHTYATFEIAHFGTSTNRARFDKKEGTVSLDRAAKTGKVEITFDMNGINSGSAAFDKHLKSDDFFAVEKFPAAKFVGDKFTFNGDKVTEVSGVLTLKDKTAPVTLKASNFNCYQNPMLKREVCGGDFTATIDRTQWGVDYGLAWGFPKEVRLVIQVEAVKQ
ncbi:polyisoprenoid-binding protein [Pelomonas sp. V22]|uniref:YceI family protein n=1 Tax=Pelomonas sp. V22 TaxID=2822139 RepID=UPI0024A97275|nr:YceI family protein [Pelomonas sp. V22]MDI4634343.1 polyisoprenoid-binding protein [Pelomonas sp. V22]